MAFSLSMTADDENLEAQIRATRAEQPAGRPAPRDAAQIARLRHEDWRAQHDDGVVGPGGQREYRSVRLIARIARQPKSVVGRGILVARQLRKALNDASRLQG